jgi:hypothetical protein
LGRYLKQAAAPRLGIDRGDPQKRLRVGSNTVVRRWLTAGLGELYARGWRYDRRVRPAAEHAAVSRLFAEAGLNVPRIILLDDSLATALRWRLEVAIETAAPGHPLHLSMKTPAAGASDSGPAIGAWQPLADVLGRELARLHGVTASEWGKPWRPDNPMRDLWRFWRENIAKLRSTLAGRTMRLSDEQVNGGLRDLGERFQRLPRPARPSLVHGDLSPAHLYADGAPESPTLTWIDFGTAHYGHPAEDLAMACGWGGQPDGFFARVMESYRREAAGVGLEPPDEGALEEAMDIFSELRAWQRIGTRVVKRRRDGELSEARRRKVEEEQTRIERRLRRRLRRRSEALGA